MKTIGKTIRELRLEHELTQEELAERLGITAQAVSRWESEAGMPDISQLVPLASIFGVSTDLLLGLSNDISADIDRIVAEAESLITYPATAAGVFAAWERVVEGLKRYPANMKLLMNALEWGICLSYPENGEVYFPERAKEIYRETLRFAKLAINAGKNSCDILRARMIKTLLLAAYGEYERAEAESFNFPRRADMTELCMRSYIFHFMKNPRAEGECLQYDLTFHLEAIVDDLVKLGLTYAERDQHRDAIRVYEAAFDMISAVFGDEAKLPAMHNRERGDIHALIAHSCLALGETDSAFDALEAMVNYDLDTQATFRGERPTSPMLRDCGLEFYRPRNPDTSAEYLRIKLLEFASELEANPRFAALLGRI